MFIKSPAHNKDVINIYDNLLLIELLKHFLDLALEGTCRIFEPKVEALEFIMMRRCGKGSIFSATCMKSHLVLTLDEVKAAKVYHPIDAKYKYFHIWNGKLVSLRFFVQRSLVNTHSQTAVLFPHRYHWSTPGWLAVL